MADFGGDMDGGGASALVGLIVVGGAFVRLVVRVDRYERRRSRRPQPVRMVPLSPLLAEPRVRVKSAPQDERPPLVEVPDRHFVRAARLAVARGEASVGLLERELPVIPAMAARLMAALEGAGVVALRDESGMARAMVTPEQLPLVFAERGIVTDA